MKRLLSMLFSFIFFLSVLCVSGSAVGSVPCDLEALLKRKGESLQDYTTVKIIPVKFYAEGNTTILKLNGDAIQLVRENDDGSIDVTTMVMIDQKYGIANAKDLSTNLISFDPSWDPINSIVTSFECKYIVTTGDYSHAFYRPYQLIITIISGNSSTLSSISFITAGYKISGALYDYPICLNTASPVPLSTSSELHVNCVYNSPVSGGNHTGTNLSANRAIIDTGAQGELGVGVKYTNGTKIGCGTMNVFPFGTVTH